MSLCLYIRELKKNKKRMLIDILLCSYMLVISRCALLLKFSIGLDKLFKKLLLLLLIKIKEREREREREREQAKESSYYFVIYLL